MKYLINALKGKALAWLVIDIIQAIIYIIFNTAILKWIAECCDATNEIEKWHYINLIIIGCVINTILAFIESVNNSTDIIYTKLCNALAKKIASVDIKFFDSISPGTINNTGGKLFKISKLPICFIRAIKTLISIIINIVALSMIVDNLKIVISVIGCFTLLIIATIVALLYLKKLDEEKEENISKRDNQLDEITNGYMEVRSFGLEEEHIKNIEALNKNIYKSCKNRKKIDGALSVIIETLITVSFMIALLYSINNPAITAATSLATVLYIWRLADPVVSLITGISEIAEYTAAVPGYNKIMEYKNSIIDGDIELTCFEKNIEIENVSFSYKASDKVLDSISMKIPKGSNIGICGSSGSGKSTLCKLIPRFYDPDEGVIKIDGIDIRRYTHASMTKYIGIVSQTIYIFNGTIKENILYGSKNKTDVELKEACEKAAIWDYICDLDDGLETQVGPKGLKLSGGQRQRIALARIFLSNPEIIIFDEATAALDNKAERTIKKSIAELKGKTLITIAHRLTTIKNCDCIYVFSKHKIVEKGTHNELMSNNGEYAELQKEDDE